MEYKGYFAKVEFDEDSDCFHGEVINIRDVVTFEGRSVDELKEAFYSSVDDYLDFCAERSESPHQPKSGNIFIRVGPELHVNIALEAKRRGTSINSFIKEALSGTLKRNTG